MPRIQKLHHACSEYHAKCADDWAVPAACCAASADIQGHCRRASSGGCQSAVDNFRWSPVQPLQSARYPTDLSHLSGVDDAGYPADEAP
jgi:hypothetical protein